MSKCGSCSGTRFKVVEQSPEDSRYKLLFIQCATCQVPVGVTEYYNSGAMLDKLEKKLKSIESQISILDHNIRAVAQALSRR